MMKYYNSTVSYLNRVNTILTNTYHKTFQALGVAADRVAKAEGEGWTEQQTADAIAMQSNLKGA